VSEHCAALNVKADRAAALNWPKHRGTATALPLAAFGLSAFFFSCLSSWLFPGNTESFLLVLAIATSSLIFVGFFFCRVVPVVGSYTAVPNVDPDNNRLHRTKSGESRHSSHVYGDDTLGTSTVARKTSRSPLNSVDPEPMYIPNTDATAQETSSLFSKSSSSSDEEEHIRDAEGNHGGDAVLDGCSDSGAGLPGHHLDIRGWALFRNADFWLLFTMLGTLCGVGLMTIKYVPSSRRR
jgi:hypothetical protein